ncbi:hypothetical protein BGZ58_007990 [Dissophora ornata]|nr:hypothetical protein BGZ58_007990 [Dissophora ornata]
MSSTSSSSTSPQPSSNTNDQNDQHKPVLTLPAPGDVPQGNINQLEVNGKDIKLDILGPVVVNENGTISRIDNWAEMTEIEKANTRRILLKRNAQRLARLRSEAGITTAEGGEGSQGAPSGSSTSQH